jgi:hypothetical protein
MTSFSTDEYRRARPTIPDGSSTRQARTINANFRRELTHFILGGGLCDLTDRSQLPNNCLQGLSPQLQSMALGEDDPAGPPPPRPAADRLNCLTPDPPITDVTCYLCLFQPGTRSRFLQLLGEEPQAIDVFQELHDNPSQWAPGYFQVTIGTATGVARGRKFSAHVASVPATTSLLRVRDLFTVLPGHLYLGAADHTPAAPSAVVPAGPPAVTSSVASVLGTAYDGRVRNFSFVALELTTDSKTGRSPAVALSYSISSHEQIRDFVKFFPHARLLELRVRAVPNSVADRLRTKLHLGWAPSTATTPTTEDELFALQENVFSYLSSASVYGCAPELTFPCSFEGDVQPTFKPQPVFGGSPTLVAHYAASLSSTAETGTGSVIYRLIVSGRVSTIPF